MSEKRTDSAGRDLTGLHGLHDESDTIHHEGDMSETEEKYIGRFFGVPVYVKVTEAQQVLTVAELLAKLSAAEQRIKELEANQIQPGDISFRATGEKRIPKRGEFVGSATGSTFTHCQSNDWISEWRIYRRIAPAEPSGENDNQSPAPEPNARTVSSEEANRLLKGDQHGISGGIHGGRDIPVAHEHPSERDTEPKAAGEAGLSYKVVGRQIHAIEVSQAGGKQWPVGQFTSDSEAVRFLDWRVSQSEQLAQVYDFCEKQLEFARKSRASNPVYYHGVEVTALAVLAHRYSDTNSSHEMFTEEDLKEVEASGSGRPTRPLRRVPYVMLPHETSSVAPPFNPGACSFCGNVDGCVCSHCSYKQPRTLPPVQKFPFNSPSTIPELEPSPAPVVKEAEGERGTWFNGEYFDLGGMFGKACELDAEASALRQEVERLTSERDQFRELIRRALRMHANVAVCSAFDDIEFEFEKMMADLNGCEHCGFGESPAPAPKGESGERMKLSEAFDFGWDWYAAVMNCMDTRDIGRAFGCDFVPDGFLDLADKLAWMKPKADGIVQAKKLIKERLDSAPSTSAAEAAQTKGEQPARERRKLVVFHDHGALAIIDYAWPAVESSVLDWYAENYAFARSNLTCVPLPEVVFPPPAPSQPVEAESGKKPHSMPEEVFKPFASAVPAEAGEEFHSVCLACGSNTDEQGRCGTCPPAPAPPATGERREVSVVQSGYDSWAIVGFATQAEAEQAAKILLAWEALHKYPISISASLKQAWACPDAECNAPPITIKRETLADAVLALASQLSDTKGRSV